ncbi:MAG TPA: hypothetical protein VNY73_06915 [Bacteroidia bacterium]|jgi:hypothetical protein|nr:hypothetical protein [Bacteroidia bacterium]
MKIKKQIPVIAIILAGIMLPALQSCKKYPDGPILSFHSRTERVANTWRVDNYKKNGNDYTSLMAGYTETYTKGGDYSYSWSGLGGTATWAFQNNDSEIKLNGIKNQSPQTLVILKLEEKQFWYYYMDGSDKKEFHMVQN